MAVASPEFIHFSDGSATVYLNNLYQPYKMKLELEGAIIEDNVAKRGGAFNMNRNTDFYGMEANLNYGTVTDNIANSTYGGALYMSENVSTYKVPDGGYDYVNPANGQVYHLVAQPIIARFGQETATTDTLRVTKNQTALDGGVAYLDKGNAYIYGNAVFGGSTANANKTVRGHGGCVYVNGGDLTMYGGKLTYNSVTRSNGYGGMGGAFYVTGGQVEVRGGTIAHNHADFWGGAFYVNPGNDHTTYINNLSGTLLIDNNDAREGGAVYAMSGNVIISGATISNNTSTSGNGGAFMIANGSLSVDHSTIINNHAPSGDGGGVFVSGGDVQFSTGTSFTTNNAKNGGALCVKGGELTLDAATISGNVATVWGGGIYVSDTTIGSTHRIGKVTLENGAIVKNNHSGTQGGGIYVGGNGRFTMTDGTIGGTTAEGNYTTAASGKGGGIYMGGGTANIQGGRISGNRVTGGYGGAVYMEQGTCTLSNNAIIGGVPVGSTSYANSAKEGGGIYSAGGTITVKGGKIQYNTATESGGAIYTNGSTGVVNVEKQTSKADVLSYIEYNTAKNGGGIYANRGTVNFSDGYIQYNYASEAGGGMYINASDTDAADYGKLYLKGSAKLIRNHVLTGHDGGGVYLKGMVSVGDTGSGSSKSTVKAENNFAHTLTGSETVEAYDCDNVTRNNIFLPDPVVGTTHHKDVITIVENRINTDETSVGFSVPHGNVPVIYCVPSSTSHAYLHQFSTGQPHQYVVFDDTHRYTAVQYSDQPDIFDPDHVYLYGFWTNEVTGDPTGDYCVVNVAKFDSIRMNMSKPCELAFFISYVNGLNGQEAHKTADARLVDDIDMSEFGWVPIGHATDGYQGTFDGNGHTITGIFSMLNTDYLDYGFIGKLNGGTIKDLYVKGASYSIEKKEGYQLSIGGLVGKMTGGTIENCEVSSAMTSDATSTIMGGLVGKIESGTIHSSIASPNITGYLMGGLAGQNAGNLKNSFTNAKLTYHGTSQYYGGLVGENSGTVENCYMHLRGTTPGTSTNYGWLVGHNKTGGTVDYCYSPADDRYFKKNDGTLTGCGHYADNASAPYTYRHRDTQVTIAGSGVNNGSTDNPHKPAEYDATVVNPLVIAAGESDKQLLLWLNHWVTAKNTETGTHPDYGPWQRPTTMVINGDLPVLMMPHTDAAAATDGDPFIYYGQVNDVMSMYTKATQAVWLYRKKENLAGNSASNAKLYIAEKDADGNPLTVIPAVGATVDAYVGVMLDNSAGRKGANPTFGDGTPDYTDWHMFSSPLVSAPLGIDYNGDETQYPFSYDAHLDGMHYYRFYNGTDTRGYFPSHRYGKEYPSSDIDLLEGNYYQEWDFYTYYEPEYHWINFKRNSNSHWHENAPNVPIAYPNETTLTQGRGYLLAAREQTFLQCHGTLANGEVTIPATYTGYYSPGYNFLGNPYLAYLDFEEFAAFNSDLWSSSNPAGYGIIDEDEYAKSSGGYIFYANGSSSNPMVATGFIAPHQGFMVHLTAQPSDPTTYFTTGQGTQPDMRSLDGDFGKFRGAERPAYPLVNMLAFDDNGNRSIATVELGRPDRGGLQLMRELKGAKCHVYCRYEGDDWTIVFTQPGLTEAAIRFEAMEDGEFTMKWDTQNGDFSYLHLIDNMTGADVDCLTTDEYRFTATTEDYRSRFRLVFGYTGIEEPEGDGSSTGSGTFAFQSGDELVVTGEGSLTMFDVTGRAVMSTQTYGTQTAASLPNVAAGVYLLHLETANGTKVQKIVIK